MDDRKKQILQAIIEEYINTAEPVSSGSLVQRYNLDYSSATIRNEMAELEKMGYQIDKKKVIISNDINTLGVHSVTIVLHKEVSFNINVKLSSL